MGFYGELAPFYDRLFPVHPRQTAFLLRLLREERARRVMDAGCGTGILLRLLAEAGYEVAGLEPDPHMARVARDRLGRSGAVHPLTLQEAGALDEDPFDALFSLGNTLAHVLDAAALRGALDAARGLLRPGGLLVVQTVNFDRWLDANWDPFTEKRVDGPAGGLVLRRAYRIRKDGELLDFTLEVEGEGLDLKLESVLRPWRAEELHEELRRAGFRREALLGDWSGEPEPAPAAITLARAL